VVINRTRAEFTNGNVCFQSEERGTWIFRIDGNDSYFASAALNQLPTACPQSRLETVIGKRKHRIIGLARINTM
jgi:hypothetical protein